MTDHTHWEELASARHDGEIDRPLVAELDAHLAGCADCTAYAERLAGLSTLAQALPVEPMPAGVPERIASALPRGSGARPWAWAFRLAVPALGAALATTLVVALGDAGRVGVFPLPTAAASEPLRTLTSLYAERVVEERTAGALTRRTVERIWFRAPDRLRVERDITEPGQAPRSELLIRVSGAEYSSAAGLTAGRPPQIELPEPLSVTVPLLGRSEGPGPVVAGHRTQTYVLSLPGSLSTRRASVDVERPSLLDVEQTVVLGKDSQAGLAMGQVSKRTRTIRYNEAVDDERFRLPDVRAADLGFHAARLDGLAVRPAAVPDGFRLVAAGRGPQGETVEYAQGALRLVATLAPPGDDEESRDPMLRDDLFFEPYFQTVELGDGRTGSVELDLYAVPRIRLAYRGQRLTVAAPLPPEQLAALVRQMYPE